MTSPWTITDKPRDLVFCPICGRAMKWGLWAVASLPGGDVVEDLAYRCSLLVDGCEAILIPPVKFTDGRLDLKGESGN